MNNFIIVPNPMIGNVKNYGGINEI